MAEQAFACFMVSEIQLEVKNSIAKFLAFLGLGGKRQVGLGVGPLGLGGASDLCFILT